MTPIDLPLTPRQREALQYVADYTRDNGHPPTFRSVGDALGVSSTHSVEELLTRVVRRGYLARVGMKARGMVLTEKGKLEIYGPPCKACGGTGRRQGRQ